MDVGNGVWFQLSLDCKYKVVSMSAATWSTKDTCFGIHCMSVANFIGKSWFRDVYLRTVCVFVGVAFISWT